MPARGPRSDLCVVVDTTSQCSNGCAASSAATRPLQASQKQQLQRHTFARLSYHSTSRKPYNTDIVRIPEVRNHGFHGR